jgi:hypothetical protein
MTLRIIADKLNECTAHQIVTKDMNIRKVCKDGSKTYE